MSRLKYYVSQTWPMETSKYKEVEDTFAVLNLISITISVLWNLSTVRKRAREAYLEWVTIQREDQELNAMMLRTALLESRSNFISSGKFSS